MFAPRKIPLGDGFFSRVAESRKCYDINRIFAERLETTPLAPSGLEGYYSAIWEHATSRGRRPGGTRGHESGLETLCLLRVAA